MNLKRFRKNKNGSQEYSPDPDYEKEALKRRADMLQAEMESIRKRLGEIDAPSSAR